MAQDPQEAGMKLPFPDQKLQAPGLESDMRAKPDYGEDSYRW
ncbi:MAG: hypothetical protein NVSMB42_05520 [Herpetosiphon sp.]